MKAKKGQEGESSQPAAGAGAGAGDEMAMETAAAGAPGGEWVYHCDEEGNEYYYNYITLETAWELPEGAAIYTGEEEAWEEQEESSHLHSSQVI